MDFFDTELLYLPYTLYGGEKKYLYMYLIVDWSKLKTISHNKLNVAVMVVVICETTKPCGKRKMLVTSMILFSRKVFRGLFSKVLLIETRDCVVELTLSLQMLLFTFIFSGCRSRSNCSKGTV